MKHIKKFNENTYINEELEHTQFEILSVKREHDGEVFNIGDQCKDDNKEIYTIKQFTYLNDGRIIIHGEEGNDTDLYHVSKVKHTHTAIINMKHIKKYNENIDADDEKYNAQYRDRINTFLKNGSERTYTKEEIISLMESIECEFSERIRQCGCGEVNDFVNEMKNKL
jgi:hypothetical protein